MKDFEYIPDHLFNKTNYDPLSAQAFDKHLHDGIKVTRHVDKLQVTVPFVCPDEKQNTITFEIKPIDDSVIEICDKGASLQMLEQRAGNLEQFDEWLSDFAKKEGRIKFAYGRNMTLTVWAVRGRFDVLGGFFDMLSYASIVANADLYPLTQKQAYGGAK